ncbi:E3 ubiquitin-protein ligase XIAP-like [Mercenaria mercenaria]|uniref:E3 ubiquitin-protein ligase XIAP-like n=1 Tax=Mercenaria mercenaria TaxID=6596 RepID=UPI00234F07E2|nr:E3 ubiquitin-protein ligase XIAP-like [Mercenaria mercenaria]
MNVLDCTPMNRNMEYYENRLKTFETYPKQMLPNKYELASAGLFYSGKSTYANVFRCHVKLSAWERSDCALREHFKWSPNCEYIRIVGAPQQIQYSGFGTITATRPSGGFGAFSSTTTGANLFANNRCSTNNLPNL